MLNDSGSMCMAVAALVLGVIGMGLWIDWKLNWRKKRDEPRQARGFDVIPTGAATPPPDERPERGTSPEDDDA